jgi:hypothetical protein
LRTLPLIAVALSLAPVVLGVVEVRGRDPASCDDMLPPRRRLERAAVGPESCRMLEARVTWQGREFVRLDLGLDGTAEGWVIEAQRYVRAAQTQDLTPPAQDGPS